MNGIVFRIVDDYYYTLYHPVLVGDTKEQRVYVLYILENKLT